MPRAKYCVRNNSRNFSDTRGNNTRARERRLPGRYRDNTPHPRPPPSASGICLYCSLVFSCVYLLTDRPLYVLFFAVIPFLPFVLVWSNFVALPYSTMKLQGALSVMFAIAKTFIAAILGITTAQQPK